jgi:hypothetical protein
MGRTVLVNFLRDNPVFVKFNGERALNGALNGANGALNGANGALNGANGALNGAGGALNGVNGALNGADGANGALNGAGADGANGGGNASCPGGGKLWHVEPLNGAIWGQNLLTWRHGLSLYLSKSLRIDCKSLVNDYLEVQFLFTIFFA